MTQRLKPQPGQAVGQNKVLAALEVGYEVVAKATGHVVPVL